MRAKRWAAALLCPALLLFCAEYPAAAETAAPPAISSLSAVVYEPESGTVLYEKDGRTARPMASTTKLMTALLASELLGAEDMVRVPAAALPVEGSQVGLAAGDEATVRDLLAALLLSSGNAGLCGKDECPRGGAGDDRQPVCHSLGAGSGRTQCQRTGYGAAGGSCADPAAAGGAVCQQDRCCDHRRPPHDAAEP